MDSDTETHTPPQEEPADEALLDRLISDEMGDAIAEVMRLTRRAQEAWYRAKHPEEGLRERKRRLTRQLISDAATTMFATRGFDNVRVSEVADRVGVSEKTIYNYFPTKESMVLDTADETVEAMARALRERDPKQSLTEVVVEAVEADMARFENVPDELVEFMPRFVAMLESTPQLRAAWLELHDRLAKVARDELAAQAGIDPREPEPTAAGRALAGLAEVATASWVRHIEDGLRGEELRAAVGRDLRRAARVLETGLWSFNLLSLGARAKVQARDAAQAAEDTRRQVVNALRQARAAWAEVRRHTHQAAKEAQHEARQQAHQHHARHGNGS